MSRHADKAKMVSEDESENSIGLNRNESSGLYCIKFHIPNIFFWWHEKHDVRETRANGIYCIIPIDSKKYQKQYKYTNKITKSHWMECV